ncbi:uncharacterized protein [Aegilops tauschii subsp. strangulata]|uniref:uncharacterized protein isoform X2 n=1 Tax=Aegilops tauschii subsp. strangulata TaxID=200361 RepID=UPI001ABBF843|nr:uncharacterized protein LOC109746388 isoform X2 [Aegilops tauschii subsp. strangulata]
MAFIASKLVRAALASRPIGDTAGGISPCLPWLYLTGDSIRRMSAAAGGSLSKKILGLVFTADINPNEKYPLVDENSIKSKESLWALYKCWCKYRGVSRSHEEMTRRFRSFRACAMSVYKANNSGSSQVSQLGPFADMTKAEIARLFPPRGPKCRFGESRRSQSAIAWPHLLSLGACSVENLGSTQGSLSEEKLLSGFVPDADPETFPLVDENSIKSKESLWDLYKRWCKYHEVSRDHEEMTHRFRSFRACAMAVYKDNNSGSSQVSQLGPFADMTKAEIARLFPPLGPKCRFGGSRRSCSPSINNN